MIASDVPSTRQFFTQHLRSLYSKKGLNRKTVRRTKSVDLKVLTVILKPILLLTSGGSWPKAAILENCQKRSPSYQAPVWTQSMEMQTLVDFTCFCRQRYRQVIRKILFYFLSKILAEVQRPQTHETRKTTTRTLLQGGDIWRGTSLALLPTQLRASSFGSSNSFYSSSSPFISVSLLLLSSPSSHDYPSPPPRSSAGAVLYVSNET